MTTTKNSKSNRKANRGGRVYGHASGRCPSMAPLTAREAAKSDRDYAAYLARQGVAS
jgi:hypothetical protein